MSYLVEFHNGVSFDLCEVIFSLLRSNYYPLTSWAAFSISCGQLKRIGKRCCSSGRSPSRKDRVF